MAGGGGGGRGGLRGGRGGEGGFEGVGHYRFVKKVFRSGVSQV